MFRPRWAGFVTTPMYLLNVFEPSASFNKTCFIKTYQVVKSRKISDVTNQTTVLAKLYSIRERSGHRIVIAQTSALTKRVTGCLFQLIAQPTIEYAT